MYKSQLSVYCQKNKLPFPVYIDEQDDDLLWTSTISLGRGACSSSPKKTKREAQDDAANNFLTHMLKYAKCEELLHYENCCLLMDIESYRTFSNLLTRRLIGLDIYVFTGNYHSEHKISDNVTKVMVNTNDRDGLNVCMQLYTGVFLAQEKYKTYYIATNDKYVDHLAKLIQDTNNIWKPANAFVVVSDEELFSHG